MVTKDESVGMGAEGADEYGAEDPFADGSGRLPDRGGHSIRAELLGPAPSNLTPWQEADLKLDRVANTYKGLPIKMPSEIGWQHPKHSWRKDSFYVQTRSGIYGWVPWIGSQIVMPIELAWIQDLAGNKVAPILKVKK